MEYQVPTVAELKAQGKSPEIIFWVGCAGSFDDRVKAVTVAFVKILNHLQVNFAVLGTEEACTGDPAKRAGNEFLFQMQAMANIEVLNGYPFDLAFIFLHVKVHLCIKFIADMLIIFTSSP